jgi:molecular chaperone DnaJ
MSAEFYKILGVSMDATADDVKRAYRKLAMEHHPDRNNGDKQAEEKFKEITEAYEVLRDPDLRANYDRYGEAGVKGAGGGRGGFQGQHVDLSEALNIFMRDFGGLGGFDAFFGGGQRTQRDRRRGQDVKVALRLTLAEVATGTTKTVKMKTLDPCPNCSGTGARKGTKINTCRTCGGSGEVRRTAQSLFGPLVSVGACPTCDGEGTLIADPCPECRGDGRVRAEKTVQVDVPAGVADHHYLTLRGHGVPGPRNGPAGDLIAVLEIEEDPRFERHEDDLVYDQALSFSQAALGADIEVPTPFGSTHLKVPHGTQTGTVFRLKGKGLPRVGDAGKGDLHVRVHVWTPGKLSAEQERLFQEMAPHEGEPPSDVRKFWNQIKAAFGA